MKFNLNITNNLTILIFTPCLFIGLLLLLNVKLIVDIFERNFWNVIIRYDPAVESMRKILGIALILLVFLTLHGLQNYTNRNVEFLGTLFGISFILIICFWICEWIIVRNIDSIADGVHRTIESFLNASDNTLLTYQNRSHAYELMRLIPCCGYNDSFLNKTVAEAYPPCREFLDSTGRFPPLCIYQIDAWFQDNLLSVLGLFADFRIMLILLLISIVIVLFVNSDSLSSMAYYY